MTNLSLVAPPTEPVNDRLTQAIRLLEYRWTLGVVRMLADGPLRYRDIRKPLGASNEAMRIALIRLTREGIIERIEVKEFPPRVDYALTDKGQCLGVVVVALKGWAEAWE